MCYSKPTTSVLGHRYVVDTLPRPCLWEIQSIAGKRLTHCSRASGQVTRPSNEPPGQHMRPCKLDAMSGMVLSISGSYHICHEDTHSAVSKSRARIEVASARSVEETRFAWEQFSTMFTIEMLQCLSKSFLCSMIWTITH